MKIVVLGSTNGTSLQGVIDCIENNSLNAKIELIISNNVNSGIIKKAIKHNIKSWTKSSKGIKRDDYDREMVKIINKYSPDLIIMVGYMRIVSKEFVNTFAGKILNIHPSLLPKFGGLMDLEVHQAVLDNNEKESGCTIHLVIEAVDAGENILQKRCEIDENETALSLKEKVQSLESKAWVEVIRNWKVINKT